MSCEEFDYDEENKNKENRFESKYQFNIKDKIVLNNLRVIDKHQFNNEFGLSYCHKFIDDNWNVYFWFTKKALYKLDNENYDCHFYNIGDVISLMGTVIDYDWFEGIEQTRLKLCKIV